MATETWFRNPHDYIREVVEVGTPNIVFDQGILTKRGIDDLPKWCATYFPTAIPYRVIAIGWGGAPEYRRGDTVITPTAVYPVWDYEADDRAVLEEMIDNPVGEDESACSSTAVEEQYRPVLGQEHRVILTNLPPANTGPGRAMIRMLRDLQGEHDEVILHAHGLYSYRLMFGSGFRSADVDPRTAAQKGKVTLPSGKEVSHEHTATMPKWTKLMGFAPVDLGVPRNRCIFNIRSAIWAGEHWHESIDFRVGGSGDSEVAVRPRGTRGIAKPGDKVSCDSCSLSDDCKYSREGGVCSVPGSETKELTVSFRSRDSDRIIDGLQTLMAVSAGRLERGLSDEEIDGELDPEVTKIINSMFQSGVKLAKLVNPTLNGGPKVGVFVNGGSATVQTSSPKQMVAAVIRELEDQGIPRHQITPEMVQRVLGAAPAPQVIEGQVIQ